MRAIEIKINAKPGDLVTFAGDVDKYNDTYGPTGLSNDVMGVIHCIYEFDHSADVFFGGAVYDNALELGANYPGMLTIELSDLELED